MKSWMYRAPALAVAMLTLTASPAAAQEVPSDPAHLHLKGYEEFLLTWQEDQGAHLAAERSESAEWLLAPVAEEAMTGLGDYRLTHRETGLCLTAGPLEDGVHALLDLVECDTADAWTVTYDTAGADYRFATPEGYLLGLGHEELREEHSTVPTEGAEVFAVDMPASLHSHEWLFAAPPPPPTSPSSPPPTSPAPSTAPPSDQSPPPSESPKPTLPTTGTALGAGAGVGVVALAGGAALLLWWRRRRALREW